MSKFLFKLLLYVILIVALIASTINDCSEEFVEDMHYTPESSQESNISKSHHLLEYKDEDDDYYAPQDDVVRTIDKAIEPVEEVVKPTDKVARPVDEEIVKPTNEVARPVDEEVVRPVEEAVIYEAISSNLVTFYKNSLIKLYPDAEILVVHEGMAADLAKRIQLKGKLLTDELMVEYEGMENVRARILSDWVGEQVNIQRSVIDNSDSISDVEYVKSMFQRAESVISSEDMEKIVSLIRDGSQITIFTPTDSSSEYLSQGKPAAPSISEDSLVQQRPQVIKPGIIIVTKRVEEGEPIPALPD